MDEQERDKQERPAMSMPGATTTARLDRALNRRERRAMKYQHVLRPRSWEGGAAARPRREGR